MYHETWSKSEKAVACRAYDQAYDREMAALADEVCRIAMANHRTGRHLGAARFPDAKAEGD